MRKAPKFTPMPADANIPFAREVWPRLKIGSKVIIQIAGKQHRAEVTDISATAVQYRTRGRLYIARFEDDIQAILWPPEESGERLIGAEA